MRLGALSPRSLVLLSLTLLATAPAHAVPLTLQVFANGVQVGSADQTRLGCVDSSDGLSAHCQVEDLAFRTVNIDDLNINIDPDPVVTGTTGVTNLFSTTQQITLLFTLPIAPIPGGTLTGGSFRGTVTDNNGDGATIAAPAGSALYTAQIDGVSGQSLYAAPASVSAGNFLSANIASASFGSPIPSLPGPAALVSIGIQLDFTLTGHDSASFTSNHVVVESVPEPQTGALVAVGLLLVAKRRRGPVR